LYFFKKILINISQPNYCYNFTTIMLQLFYFVEAFVCQIYIKRTCVWELCTKVKVKVKNTFLERHKKLS